MRVRIEDVAERAGVSTASVSLVLRDRPGPSAATRERVRAVAEELGYRPDRAASVLARHRSRLIGVLLDVTHPFHGELVLALDEAAGARGLDLVLSTTTARRDEAAAVETLLDFRCEGLALLGPGMPRAALDQLGVRCPTVVIGRTGSREVPGVRAADGQGLEVAVDHLTGLGHERIAFVDGPRGSIATARRRGYREAMARHGLSGLVDVIAGGSTEQGGVAAAGVVVARAPAGRPTGIVCFNDRCAIGLRDSLIRAGIDVPEGVSVVGYDDSALARLGTVGLTSVSQDPVGLASATMAILGARLDGHPPARPLASDTDVVVVPRLVVRRSSAPPREISSVDGVDQ